MPPISCGQFVTHSCSSLARRDLPSVLHRVGVQYRVLSTHRFDDVFHLVALAFAMTFSDRLQGSQPWSMTTTRYYRWPPVVLENTPNLLPPSVSHPRDGCWRWISGGKRGHGCHHHGAGAEGNMYIPSTIPINQQVDLSKRGSIIASILSGPKSERRK